VLRAAPCLFGLFSLLCLIYHRLTRGEGAHPLSAVRYEKADPTFADAVASVRRLLWSQTVLTQADRHKTFKYPARPTRGAAGSAHPRRVSARKGQKSS
jgi:hypothetical protein